MASLALPILAAVVVVAATMALAYLLARLVRRGARDIARRRAQEFERLLWTFVAAGSGANELRRAARETDDGAFWAAVEGLDPALDPVRRRRLGALLERGSHALAERRALRDDSPWRRELAARRLAQLSSPGTRRALRRAMVGGPEPVTVAAALALGRLRDRAALRWVLANPGAIARRTPRTRVALLRSFGPAALGAIAETLERGVTDPRLERAMIESLGLGGVRDAARTIERRLSAADVDVRVAAARSLGRLSASECSAALIACLADPQWPVRAQAARSLGLAGASDAIVPLAGRLTDRAWWVRRHAAYALLALGDAGRQALRDASGGSPDPYARDIANEALAGGFPRTAA
jgi:HEAT repeat protein